MKDIMASYSSELPQGVPTYEYNPFIQKQPSLLCFRRPLDDLIENLMTKFKGQCLRRIDIYNKHHIDKPYIGKNYKDALLIMEQRGLIKTDPPSSKRRPGTFSEKSVLVTFPEK